MKHRLLLLIAVVFAVLLTSCRKEKAELEDTQKDEPLTQIIIGEKPKNSISIPFEPIVIERVYGGHKESINFAGKPCLLISNGFYVSHADYQEHTSQGISTLDNCTLRINESKPAVFKSGDVVPVDGEFQSNNYALPALSDDSYLVFKFESDKKYIGWIKILSYGNIIVNDYCLYVIK